MALIHGVDVSRYQRDLDMARVKRASPPGAFAIVKASQDDWQDPAFAKLSADARRDGLVPGAYHFLVSNGATPERQAEAFVRAVKSANGGKLDGFLLALDVEPFGSSQPTLQDVRRWARRFRQLAGNDRWLFLYTRSGVWARFGNPRIRDVMGSRTVLWEANWAVKPGARTAGFGGLNWTIHQHGPFPGLRPRIVDGNVFAGSVSALRAYTRPKAAAPAPPVTPDPPDPPVVPDPAPDPELARWVRSLLGAGLRADPASAPLVLAAYGCPLLVAGPIGSGAPEAGVRSGRFVAVASLAGARLEPPLWALEADLTSDPPSTPL